MSLTQILRENLTFNNTLIVVDIQPEYESGFEFDTFAFTQYLIDMSQTHDILYLYNGEELGMISEQELKRWLDEEAMFDEHLMKILENKTEFYDKGYAYFRSCIDEGFAEEFITDLVSFMWDNGVRDTRDIDKEMWKKYINNVSDLNFRMVDMLRDHNEILYLPELMDKLNDENPNNITMVGGGRSECLKEVEIAMNALGLNYKLNKEFVY